MGQKFDIVYIQSEEVDCGHGRIETRKCIATEQIKLNLATRLHWAVENQLHWTLDMTFNEDYSRARLGNAAKNFAMVSHTALNLLKIAKPKFKKDTSLKGLRKMVGWDNNTLSLILK